MGRVGGGGGAGAGEGVEDFDWENNKVSVSARSRAERVGLTEHGATASRPLLLAHSAPQFRRGRRGGAGRASVGVASRHLNALTLTRE